MVESLTWEEHLVTKGGILSLKKILSWRQEMLDDMETVMQDERMNRRG